MSSEQNKVPDTSIFDAYPFAESSHLNMFAENPLIRDSEHIDDALVASARKHPQAVTCLFFDGDPIARRTSDGRLNVFFPLNDTSSPALKNNEMIYLGLDGEQPVFAGWCQADPVGSESIEQLDMRSLANSGAVTRAEMAVVSHGFSLLSWHANHPFCAKCGHESDLAQGGYRRTCPNCGAMHFPRLDPVTIMLVSDGDRALLGRQPHFAEGMYSCLAGFVEPGESLEEAVRREVKEESGIDVGIVRYFSSQPWPFPYTLMIGCFAQAHSLDIAMDETELEDCRWFTRTEILEMMTRDKALKVPPEMAIAHQLIKAFVEYNPR